VNAPQESDPQRRDDVVPLQLTERRNGREWFALVGLVLVAATFSIVAPGILLGIPFAMFAVALPPRRPVFQLVGIVLLAFILSAHATGMYWYFERVWTLLIGAWFIAFVFLLPRAGFIARAIASIAASAATGFAFLSVTGGFGRLDAAITKYMKDIVQANLPVMQQVFKTKDGATIPNLAEAMNRMADLQVMLFPALLSLASLAALGAGWWIFRRAAAHDAQPLRPLREFRFSDHLVWLLVIGAVLMLLPANFGATHLTERAGSNLVLFMAVLYALRGLAVWLMIAGMPGPFGMIVGAVMVVVFFPLMAAATMIVGLTDTWLDIRARRPLRPPPVS
jgi:hypothetical protein